MALNTLRKPQYMKVQLLKSFENFVAKRYNACFQKSFAADYGKR